MLFDFSVFDAGKVSVLIPCHQHGHLLPQAVESVFRQSYPDYEIIIVNDGSTDNTHQLAGEYARKYPERIRYIYQEQQGQVIARRNGSALIRGEFLITLDADDILEPDMMAKCVESLRDNPEAVAVAADVWMVGEDGCEILDKLDQSRVPSWPDILKHNTWGGIAGIMIRSASLRKVGWFDFDGPAGGEDWDIWIRFARTHQKLLHIPYPLARYRQSATSHSRLALKALQGILRVLDSVIREDPRLHSSDNPYPPVDTSFYNGSRNQAVLFHYGVAFAARESETILQKILTYFLPCDLDLEELAKSYIKGNLFVTQWQDTNIYYRAFQEPGLKILQAHLERELSEDISRLLIDIIYTELAERYTEHRQKNSIWSRMKKIVRSRYKTKSLKSIGG